MLAYAAATCGQRTKVAGRVDELARLLIPHARSERVLVNIAVHPTLVFKFAVPHVLLSKLGYCDAVFDDFLRSCVSAQGILPSILGQSLNKFLRAVRTFIRIRAS